jgi:hypothetical protein
MEAKTIDITPIWTNLMPTFFMVLEHGTDEGKNIAREELLILARKVDELNARGK